MLRGLFAKGTQTARAVRVPDGVRVYAVGDIHGRIDLLGDLHRLILDDLAAAPRPARPTVVYLGDYVDRGPHSRDVIDLLLDRPLGNVDHVFLKGNHEQAFLDFLDDPSTGPGWFAYGGDATVLSYGVRQPRDAAPGQRYEALRAGLRDAVPADHLAFLSDLKLTCVIGDYLFVHAGIRPGKPLDRQDADDLLWIREEFHRSKADHGKVIVHGHSITNTPQVRPNRIGIDTGAFFSNVLTCLVLEGDSRRFLATGEIDGLGGQVIQV